MFYFVYVHLIHKCHVLVGRERLQQNKLEYHICSLEKMNWGLYLAKPFLRERLAPVKDDVSTVIDVLRRHLEYLGRRAQGRNCAENNKKRPGVALATPTRDPIVAAFKISSKVVSVGEGEFWAEIDPAHKKQNTDPGFKTSFSRCVDSSVKDIFRML